LTLSGIWKYAEKGGKIMKDIVEIRWHGRGGQGAKTACLLLADVAFSSGKHVQGFPEYGPERMGAPITAYNRISSERCSVHSNIYNPDYVVVVDETLLTSVDVTKGLKESGAIIINSEKKPNELRHLLRGYQGKVYTIDARRISEETLGKNFPNTPMLAAAVKVSNVVDADHFIKDMEASFLHKFASKPSVVEGNMKAIKKSLEEVCAG
jgi:pyruvate ferredoxin oxidoreductase gamma subunit